MKLKQNILILALCSVVCQAFAQEALQKKADYLFNNFAFNEAAELYKIVLNKNENKDYISRQLGDCYSYMREPEKAIEYYKTIVTQENVPVEYYYKYAQALRATKNYETSRTWLRTYQDKGGQLEEGYLSKDATFIDKITNTAPNYVLKNAFFNSIVSDFGAFEHKDTIYFASTANKGVLTKHRHAWDAQPFLDVYATAKTADTIIHHKAKLKGRVNSTYHDGPLVITNDGKTMYFSRNNFIRQKLGESNVGINHLKLYKASYKNGKWTHIKELPFNDNNYSIGHPTLNRDETRLYFSSDRPGGFGGSDIYYVAINKDGTYGKPVNAGKAINTKKNELFPFVNSEDILFFSSDGHQGLGLLDIYVTAYNADKIPTHVVNLGLPINSSKDDFSFFMNTDAKTGYIASNREGGLGKDDIYTYTKIPQLKVSGTVRDAKGQTPINNCVIKLTNPSGQDISYVETNANGTYSINIDREVNYKLTASKANYADYTMDVSSSGVATFTETITANFELREKPKADIIKSKPVAVVKDLGAIYFNFDSAEIKESDSNALTTIINTMLNTYPEMTIKIESFSDARGPESYNDALSQKRAEATYNYLISKGINPSRIVEHKGYGEHDSTKHCETTPKECSKKDYELSRRTNFIVVNTYK